MEAFKALSGGITISDGPAEPAPGPGAPAGLGEVEAALGALASREGGAAVIRSLERLLSARPAAADAHLLAGRWLLSLGQVEAAFRAYSRASDLAPPGELTWRHPDTGRLVLAQLRVEPAERPATARAEGNLRRNVSALEDVDPETAEAILLAQDPPDVQVIDVWGSLFIANPKTGRIAVESEKTVRGIHALMRSRTPIAFFGPGSGQEILQLLRDPPKLFLGMRSAIYLFEKDARLLRNFFRLEDISEALRERSLVVFGGEGWNRSVERTFSTRRFPAPSVAIGDKGPYLAGWDRLREHIEVSPATAKEVGDYYSSEAFERRLRDIAEGRELPRVLFLTCRWTTVLRYVCADFRRGFEDLGCSTETVIEGSDVESLAPGFYLHAIERLRPDFTFSVSHARPSYTFLPKGLPVMCFFMDRLQPILDLPRLDGRIQPADIFFCMFDDFVRFLGGKGVPSPQLARMATPADERVYRPLDPGDPLLEGYRAEVSWVKHGGPDARGCLQDFLSDFLGQVQDPFQAQARKAFEAVHAKVHAERRLLRDGEVLEMVLREFPRGSPPEWAERVKALVIQYIVLVYALDYRQRLLEPLARSGLRLRLFGNGWDRHPLFSRSAAGPVARGERLNAVYNASAINLNVHTIGGMHQRLAEGALAGGFFLVNRVEEGWWESLDPYFEEGREVVSFTTERDLLDKCRYYLQRPDERRAIAGRMRERALRDLTVKAAAGEVLRKFRERWSALKA